MTARDANHSPAAPSAYDFDSQWPIIPVDREAVRVFHRRGRVSLVYCQLRVGDVSDAPLPKILECLPTGFPVADLVSVGRVRTLKEGVERIIRNVIANPHIDTLILLGRDSKVFRPLRGLDCLMRHGIDADGHILGPDQDDAVRRVFARDSLVNLTAQEIDYFRRRTGVRIVADLVDGPATAAEALAASASLFGERPVGREPSWDFLSELDIASWRAEKTIEVSEPYAADGVLSRFGLEVWEGADKVGVTAQLAGAEPLRMRIGRTVNLASEKLVHTWLRWARPHTAPTEIETCEAAIRFEEALLRGGEAHGPRTVGLEGATDPTSGIDATLTPFTDDPKGYFLTRVDYERGQVLVDVHQNLRPGDPASSKQVCTVVGTDIRAVLRFLLDKDYFGRHEQRLEHIGYIALTLARALHAVRTGYGFTQDKPPDRDTRRNVDWKLNAAVVIESPTLDHAWRSGLASLQRDGLITATQKGRVLENWCTLFHIADMAGMAIPPDYPSSEANIAAYAEEFFLPLPPGSQEEYTYGDRMCHHYGFDQVAGLIRRLKARPRLAHPSQRFDPWTDLGKSHIPCLAFDVWFLHGGRLHTVQIPRSHDIAGAMPQNALGVARGWAERIADALDVPRGDLVFLSTSNNYRVADDAETVRRIVDAGAAEPGPGVARPLLPPIADAGALDIEPSPVRFRHWPDPPADAELDLPLIAATLSADTRIGHRLRRHRNFDQIAVFADHLNHELAKNPRYRTQYGLLSPRDPVLDRDGEHVDLLSLQLRNQLGKLHAAAVFVNSARDEKTQLSVVAAVQREAARLTNHPPGSVFILNVLPQGHSE